jgi:hypothetical protein
MKYIVAEKASFIANGRIYKPGDEIDSELFKFEKTLQAAVFAGKLKPVQNNPGGSNPGGNNTSGGGDTTGGNPGGDNTTGGGDTGGGGNAPGGGNIGDGDNPGADGNIDDTSLTPKKRKAMEKAAIDNGLRSPEEIKSLSDKDLAELLTATGVVA